MKILYGINTNGQGHINRARIFIDQLIEDGHEVHVILSGKKPPSYAFDLAPTTIYKVGPIDIYKDHRVDVNKTLQNYIASLPDFNKTRREIIDLAAEENYDFLITDFEPMTSSAGRKIGKPVICIDRQHAIVFPTKDDENLVKGYERLGYKWGLNLQMPYYDHCYTLDFTDKIQTNDDVTLFPIIKKPELLNYDITTDNHYVAYFPRYDIKELTAVFSKFTDEHFIIYGYDKDKKKGNITFKKTSREGFLTDLTSSKGVISSAGFNLLWETALVKKLVWAIPHVNILEQVTNANDLKVKDIGYVSEKITEEDFSSFRDWAEKKNYTHQIQLTVLTAADLLNEMFNFLDTFVENEYLNKRQMRRVIKKDLSPWRMKQEIRKELKFDST